MLFKGRREVLGSFRGRPDRRKRSDRPGKRPHRPGKRPHRRGKRPHRPGKKPHRPGKKPHRPGKKPHRRRKTPDRRSRRKRVKTQRPMRATRVCEAGASVCARMGVARSLQLDDSFREKLLPLVDREGMVRLQFVVLVLHGTWSLRCIRSCLLAW